MFIQQTLLNVGKLILHSRTNGPGNRVVIWMQGCSIGCIGCKNIQFLSQKRKRLIYPKQLLEALKKHAPDAEGITLTGGEPFDQIDGCSALLKAAQQMGLSTVVYTGYSLEYLKKSQNPLFKQALEYIDILIDGPYKKEMSGRYLWRGSSNQRIILLSDRYSKDDLTIIQHVDEEVFIYNNNKEQGTIVQTGIVKTTIF